MRRSICGIALALAVAAQTVCAQDTGLTYQGHLADANGAANGALDMTFSLWDAAAGGTMLAGPLSLQDVAVEDGLFTAALDFGAEAFGEGGRWLEIGVEGTTLSPRQPVTRAPYAIQTRGVFVNNAGTFLGIGGKAQLTTAERFGVRSPAADGQYGGMYMNTEGAGGWPFYGYATGGSSRMWTYYDGATQNWHVHNGGRRLTVTSDGFVGIGDDSPTKPLAVRSNTANQVLSVQSTRTGTATALSAAQTDGTDATAVHGFLQQGTGGQAVWGTTFNSNSIGVRGTAAGSPSVVYGVVGEAFSSSGFDFYAQGSGMNYGAESSARWKREIEPMGGALAMLDQVRGVRFVWDTEHGGARDIGFIAEEVGRVLPEIVAYEDNGVDAIGMDYSKMSVLLVAAVKELREQKDEEIGALRAQNEELLRRLERVEAALASVRTGSR